MKKIALFFLVGIFIFSCSDPLDKKYSEANFAQDAESIKQSNKVTPEDSETFAKYIVSSKLTGNDLTGKTYKQIISEAKEAKLKFETEQAEQQKLAAEAKKIHDDKIALLNDSLKVILFDKSLVKGDYGDNNFKFIFLFQNNGKKSIKAFKGNIYLNDLFDTNLYSMDITFDTGIKAGNKTQEVYTSHYNQFMDGDKATASKPLSDMKVVWEPEKIIFSDGSSIDAL